MGMVSGESAHAPDRLSIKYISRALRESSFRKKWPLGFEVWTVQKREINGVEIAGKVPTPSKLALGEE